MTSNPFKQPKGFTLIETLVAVLLLATAIAGPLTIASKSLIAALVAKNQIAAFFLAQDAIEFVRFARDTNRLQGGDWITGVGSSKGGVDLSNCRSAEGCYFDSTLQNPNAVTACVSGGCAQPLVLTTSKYLYLTNGRYAYNSAGTRTTFVRQVIISDVVSGEEANVLVTVYWSDAGKERKVQVQENIFNWQ